VDFPALFADFGGKRFTLLWRGSRDGFRARDSPGRGDADPGHVGAYFRGLHAGGVGAKQLQLDGRSESESFRFTLKNPHNLPARKFALKAEKRDRAAHRYPEWGPYFSDLHVFDNCHANSESYSSLGDSYANDTGLDGRKVLKGSQFFTVKEIEVFEICNQ
jgi:hypothetical protein